MESYQDHCQNRLNQVRDSSSTNIRHGFSKAQSSLHKILHIISFSKPCEALKESFSKPRIDSFCDETTALCLRTGGFDVDLNLRLGPNEEKNGDGGLSACSAVGEAVESISLVQSDVVSTAEKCLEGESEAYRVSVEANHVSEITNSRIRSIETDNKKVHAEHSKVEVEDRSGKVNSSNCRDEGFLGLLIEAAKQISVEFEDDNQEAIPIISNQNEEGLGCEDETGVQSRSKRKHREVTATLCGDFEDISPVVRSKRGRNQVLPHRYRDSVMEPLKPSSKRISTSTKRRS